MKVVYLTTLGTNVRRKGDRLQVWEKDNKITDLPLFNLERLVVVGAVQFTTQALTLLLDRGIDVSFLTTKGRMRGSLLSAESRNVYLRLAQFERWKDPDFRLNFSRHLVAVKLRAQERLISRYDRNHPGRLDRDAVDRLRALMAKLTAAETLDQLRGYEGAGAAIYYKQFSKMLTTVEFPGRKKHPATDPANALLSLGYVLLTNDIAALLGAQGFDPAVGFFHGIRYGRQSLSLDVVEPFRQPIIDRLTLRLFNRRQFSAETDFEGGDQGVRLQPDAFKNYLAEYEDHLRSPSEGKASSTWRERLHEQAASLKEMILAGDVAPFYSWSG